MTELGLRVEEESVKSASLSDLGAVHDGND